MPFAVMQWFSFYFSGLKLEHSKLPTVSNLNYKILLIPWNKREKVVSVSYVRLPDVQAYDVFFQT